MGTELVERLVDGDRRATVTALPDGSVDRFYEVFVGDDRIRRRESFAEAASGSRSAAFTRRESAVEPGGHAVNMATQADLFGDDVTLVGHLDDPVFADLPFEAISTGDPSRVDVYAFEDGDVLAVEPSTDAESWTLSVVEDAVGERFETLLSADAVFCTNWTTFDALPETLSALAEADVDGGYFVLDPGSLAGRSDGDVRDLFTALDALAGPYDVVLAANGGEVRALDGALDGNGADRSDSADLGASLDRLRAAADLAGAVVHEADAAAAATADGRLRVENYDVDAVRHTGGGDRFDAGLVHALVRDWGWRDALRLGNACASRYVATGESATPSELASFLRERE